MHASYESRLKSPTKRLHALDRYPSKRRARSSPGGGGSASRILPDRSDPVLPLPFDGNEPDEEELMDAPTRGKALYGKVVEAELIGSTGGRRQGSRKRSPSTPPPFSLSPLSEGTQRMLSLPARAPERCIAKVPYKVLDAPGMADDFYYSVLDWGASNTLAVGLGSTVYLSTVHAGNVSSLDGRSPYRPLVTCVKFENKGGKLVVGREDGTVALWDTEAGKQIAAWRDCCSRVGTVHWSGDEVVMGSRDRTIVRRDIRDPASLQRLRGHTQEVCGVRWSPDGIQLATGGNDNVVMLWDKRRTDAPTYHCREHHAAVRALAWSPVHRGLLVSGGGTADRSLVFTNALAGTTLSKLDTGSQISNIEWSPDGKELVSSHGFSLKGLIVWRYHDMKQLGTLTGHSARILYMAPSPDRRSVATGSGDETIRLWSVFSPELPSDVHRSVLQPGQIR